MNKKVNLNLSTLQNIDQAMFNFIESLKIHSTTNKGWKPVPFLWTGAERAYQVKNDLRLRDSNGVLILPQVTARRTGTGKKPDFKGKYYAAIPEVTDDKGGMRISWTRRVKTPKTSEFARARSIRQEGKLNFKATKPLEENKKIVYDIISIPNIVYLDLNYVIVLRSEFQQQMNEMITPFLVKSGNHKFFTIKNEDWTYECFFDDDYSQNDNVDNFDEEERVFKTEIGIRVLGYIMGSGDNDEQPTIVRRENAVEVKMEESIVTAQEFEELFGD